MAFAGVVSGLLFTGATTLAADGDLRNVFPEQRPPALPDEAAPAPAAPPEIQPGQPLPAQPGETAVIDRLRGVVFLPDDPRGPLPAASGIDVSRQPALGPELASALAPLLDRPVSVESLDRLVNVVRTHLRGRGTLFALVYLPEQDVTEGVIAVVVRPSRLAGLVKVEGAEGFPADDYRAALDLKPGEVIDGERLNRGIAWLNRNPFRNARVTAEPGPEPGSTALLLQARDRFPLRVFGGLDNTGTERTGTERRFAGFDWGDAFGTGDLLTYQFKTDREYHRSRSHSLSYTHYGYGGDTGSVYAAYSSSRPTSSVPAVSSDSGSWQVGGVWLWPLPAPVQWITHSAGPGFDFKAGENTSTFLGLPLQDTLTHVVQWSLHYNAEALHWGGRTSLDAALFASPGGITGRNANIHFSGSRFGATADYAYGRITLNRIQPLTAGVDLSALVTTQVSNSRLIGSEQFAGGGFAGVRGYPEDMAYADNGVLTRLETGVQPVTLLETETSVPWLDSLRLFAFFDYGKLWNHRPLPEERTVVLASAGFGLTVAVGRTANARFSFGVPLRDGPTIKAGNPRSHFAVTIAY